MLVTVEWCTRGVDVGSTLNWNANTQQCICTHGVFTYTQCIYIQYWGGGIFAYSEHCSLKHGILLSVTVNSTITDMPSLTHCA